VYLCTRVTMVVPWWQGLSSYAHLVEGGIVQKRMLDASFQVS